LPTPRAAVRPALFFAADRLAGGSSRSESDTRREWLCFSAGALVGLVVGLYALDPEFIAGTGGKWVRPENDYVAYLVAWNYYIADAWRFPVFNIPAMGYPEGGSVLFNDALPLAALATKVVYRLSGARINPFGWWIFLTYVLQGAMAARLVWSVGVRSLWACGVAAAIAAVSISFVSRMGHTALSSHFLLIWALALHFSSVRQRRARAVESFALLAITLLINAYLFVMVFAIVVATLAALWGKGALHAHDLRNAAVGVAAVVLLGLAAGYGAIVTNGVTLSAQGFGHYSWNTVSLLLPPDGIFGYLQGISRDATHGQYEGEAFIGRGALLLLLLCAISAPRKLAGRLRQYWILTATLVGFVVFAASNRVYVGDTLVLAYELPRFAIDLGSSLRASGRFIWPLAYCLTILPLACLFRWWPPLPAIAASSLAVLLQVSDALPGMDYRRGLTTKPYDDLIDEDRWRGWLSQHDRVWQLPSWDCGGLSGSNRKWPSAESNRELQVQLAAARAGVPTNSVYTSRALKDCGAEAEWRSNPRLVAGALYVFELEAVRGDSPLSRLAQSSACVTLEWAVVCSLQWERTAAGAPSSPPTAR
jgi:hypothetical protein